MWTGTRNIQPAIALALIMFSAYVSADAPTTGGCDFVYDYNGTQNAMTCVEHLALHSAPDYMRVTDATDESVKCLEDGFGHPLFFGSSITQVTLAGAPNPRLVTTSSDGSGKAAELKLYSCLRYRDVPVHTLTDWHCETTVIENPDYTTHVSTRCVNEQVSGFPCREIRYERAAPWFTPPNPYVERYTLVVCPSAEMQPEPSEEDEQGEVTRR